MNGKLTFLPLWCGVRHYAWGCRRHGDSQPYLASLLGQEAGDEPWAELWAGAHPSLSARVLQDGRPGEELCRLLADEPALMLGAEWQSARQLPFLLKILSCEQPLSIQCHPDLEQARRLRAARPDLYPDAGHKPEIIVALTPFELLAGFRSREEIVRLLSARSALRGWLERGGGELRPLVASLRDLSEAEVAAMTAGLASESADEDVLFRRLAAAYPGDRGAFFAYLLNHRLLQPGESQYVGAGILHAYLQGTGVECMANSDNVIRAGLTAKAVAWDDLLDVADFSGREETAGQGVQTDALTSYPVPVSDFELRLLREGAHDLGEQAGRPGVLLVLSGEAEVSAADTPQVGGPGCAWFRPACLAESRVTLRGTDSLAAWACAGKR